MFKPTSDFIICQEFEEKSRIALPQGVSNDDGKTFKILDVGPGCHENGVRIKPDVEIGDRVMIVGKMLRMPFSGNNGSATELLIGRAGDCIAYEREKDGVPSPESIIESSKP